MYLDELNVFFNEVNKTLFQARSLLGKKPKLSLIANFNIWLFKDDIKIVERQLDFIIKRKRLVNVSNPSAYSIAKCEEALEKSLSDPKGKEVFRMLLGHLGRKESFLEKIICEAAFRNKSIIDSSLIWINAESIKLIENKLFTFKDSSNRVFYANAIAQDIDSKLCTVFEDIVELEKLGCQGIYIRRDIEWYIRGITSLFSNFDIDLIDHLKEYNDFDPEFGDYNAFRAEKYANKSTSDKKELPEDIPEAAKKDNKQEDITAYLALNDEEKKEWLYQGMQYNTVKELAEFIAQSYTNKILRKIPSKKGGGLWNLAKAAFQIEDTITNRKTIENEFNLVYNHPLIPNKFK